MKRKILILGATSAIASKTALILAQEGHALFLAGRNEASLRDVSEQLTQAGAGSVSHFVVDLSDTETHEALLQDAASSLQGIDTVLLAYGTLGDQRACEQDWALAHAEINTNFTSAASLLSRIANRFQDQGSGCIVAISSVAGDRGRGSNYIYGASKGALSLFLQGLRNRLYKHGVQVVTVKPGFVSTPMTAHLKQGPLFVEPDVVAKGIVRAMKKGKNVVYLPLRWRLIMIIIKSIPEWIFKRLGL